MTHVVAPESVTVYPVHVTAAPVPDRPSRGLWLVKWLLVIPHLVILLVLWPAFVVLTVAAFVAILVTGRYPRPIFDFNVGVLRWSWRVAYYSYGALGTDRYPPFTLHDDPTYPARLDVDYPHELSRGLVLVKWWLLAIPHYLVIVVLADTVWWLSRDGAVAEQSWHGSLITVLVLIAGVALLFTGRYPQGVYDLLLGLHRWVLRVVGYAALLTDEYPPFRLDQGARAGLQDSPRPAFYADTSRWAVGPLVAGSLVALLGVGLLAGGLATSSLREDGFVTTPSRTIATEGYAAVTTPAQLEGVGLGFGLGEVRVRTEAADGTEVFVGVAAADDAAAYLDGVQHTVLTEWTARDREVSGGAPLTPPATADIWVTSASGPGAQAAQFSARSGSWVAVVMPTDGTPGLEATLDVGATLPWLPTATGAFLLVGGVLAAAGVLTIVLGTRAAGSTSTV